MDTGEYCGPLKELIGQRALILPDETYSNPLETRTLKAQFNKIDLQHPETGILLCYGWHTFPASDFKILVPVKW